MLKKLLILFLKVIPMMLAGLAFINTVLAYFEIYPEWLAYIGGTSVLTLMFLYLASYVFKFCEYHRMFLHYVVACNTISALALEVIKAEFDVPFIGVVKPGARVAAEATRNKRVGVIATAGTIQSQIYTDYIQGIEKDIQVIGKACPLFVPLVEEGLLEDPVTDEIATRYLNELKDINIDTLILGCTHYPLIRSTVGRIMGDEVTLVNPAYETARELKGLLEKEGLLNPSTQRLGTNQYQFFVSDGADKFKAFANSILKYGILSAQIIRIEEY